MANISVRNIDNTIYKQLQLRALEHGVSMEEEARQIISQAVTAPDRISTVFQKHFGIKNGINLDISTQNKPHNPMDFNE
jgi:plasmid stability protein